MRLIRTFLLACLLLIAGFPLLACAQEETAERRPLLLVLNKNAASMTVYDAVSLETLGTVGVGDSPHEVVVSEDGRTAYVANYGAREPGSTLSVVDLKERKEVRRVDLSPLQRPHGIQMINGKVYFTAEVNRAIARYDPAANRVDWIMGTGQDVSHMIAGSADEKRFYTTNIASDSVTAFELGGGGPFGSRITQIPVGKQPEAMDLAPDGGEVWVGLNAEGAVEIVDTGAKKVTGRIVLGARPYRVRFTPDGKRVLATLLGQKEIVVIDPAARKETGRIKLDSVPWGITFTKDSKLAYVTAAENDLVYRIDLGSGKVLGQAKTGSVPDGVALAGL